MRRALQRLQQPQPVARRRRAEDAARAVDDGGDAGGLQRVAHERGVAVRADEHGDVPGAHALAPDRLAAVVADLDLRLGREQAGEVGREVLGDVLACGGVADAAAARALQPRVVAVDDADAQRRALAARR